MGQSTVIATVFTAIMFVAGVSVLIMSTVSSFGTLSEAITDKTQMNNIILNERIEFGDWSLVGANGLDINVSNIGSTSIMLSNFNKMDLLISYNNGTSEQTTWVTYNQAGSASNYWSINRVFFRNSQQDLINPISLSGTVRGAWDPEETLELEIHLDVATPTFEYLTLITPNGIQTHSSLTKAYDMGVAIVPTGTRIITVYHQLDRVPVNVQLTPGSDLNTEFWVGQVDSDSFEIHLSNNPTRDIIFYWRIE
jgi:hypothetical protein